MEALKDCLLHLYLKWQQDSGRRGSVAGWAKHLDPSTKILSRAFLAALMRGDNSNASMRVAYQMFEKTGDPCVLEILGYPVPDAPLIGLADTERAAILDWLESVKVALDAVPFDERMLKLNEILDGMPDADAEVE